MHEVNLGFLSSFFLSQTKDQYFAATPSARKVHEMKIIWEGDVSVTDTGSYDEKLRGLPIGDEPMTF